MLPGTEATEAEATEADAPETEAPETEAPSTGAAAVRPLDGFERHWWAIQGFAPVAVVCTARLGGHVTADRLRPALSALQARHGLLRARFADQHGVPAFAFDVRAPMPLRALPRAGPDAWVREATEELHASFGPPGPLARCTLLEGEAASEVLFAFHHALGDASGGFEVLRELAHLLGPRGADAAARLREPLPIPGALRDHVRPGDDATSARQRLRIVMGVARILAARRASVPQDHPAALAERRTRLLPRMLEPSATEGLAARAKAEGTTVHGALCAAAMLAHRAEAPGTDARLLGCASPVNVRRYLATPPRDAMGFYAAIVPTFHRVGRDTPLWDLARGVRRRLDDVVAQRAMFRVRALFDRAVPLDAARGEAYAMRLERLKLVELGVTNLGRQEVPGAPDAMPVEALHFAAPATVGGAKTLLAATTVHGTLHMNFLSPDPLVSAERAARIADATVAGLRAAAQEG